MLSRSARQTQFGFAVRAGAVTLGRKILCADTELFEERTDGFQHRDIGTPCGHLRFEVPPCHVFAAACIQIARKEAEQHINRGNGAKTGQKRASHKQRDNPENQIRIKQCVVERVHAITAIHEAHEFFGKFHIVCGFLHNQ